jgi:regulatory protein
MKPPKQLSSEELFSYAVKKLSGRAASVGEIRSALLARALHPEDVPGILDRLREYGYLNDARFAESYTAARLENEGFGKSRVLRDLQQRRIAPELADQTVSQIYAGQDEIALIEQFIRRKYKRSEGEILFQTDNELASAYRRLVRAGFGPSNALRVLKRFAANPDLLEEL